MLLGLVCMGLLFRDGGVRGVSAPDLVLAGLVPLGYAVSNTFIKKRLSGMPSLFMTAMILGMTSLAVTPVAVVVEGVKPVGAGQMLEAIVVLAWLGRGGHGAGDGDVLPIDPDARPVVRRDGHVPDPGRGDRVGFGLTTRS